MKNKKIRSVTFNNRKKQLMVTYTSGKRVVLHYGNLNLRSNIREVWIDPETRGQSVGIRLENGKVDYMPYDQPLALVKDPEFLLQSQIELLTAKILKTLRERKISKKYLAAQLHTSNNQIQRLLNPKILNKNLSQLYQIASHLGLEVEITLKAA